MYVYVHVLQNDILDFSGCFDENFESVPDKGQKTN